MAACPYPGCILSPYSEEHVHPEAIGKSIVTDVRPRDMPGKFRTPSSETRCAYAGCQLPRQVGQYLCADHRGRPKTLKESIAAGPKFKAHRHSLKCSACDEPSTVDDATGLCRECWPAWRFSMERKG